MSPIGQIEREIQQLPFNEQVDLLVRLVEGLKTVAGQLPSRNSFSNEAELHEKVLEGLNGSSSPMTEVDWEALEDRITRKTQSTV